VNNNDIGAHGRFWRPLDLAGFKAKKVYGKQLVVPNSSAQSNLVLALRGQSPFGSDIGVQDAQYPRMPAGMPAVPEDQIQFISKWIDDGCPDEELTP
jgi:tyrosinase